LTSRLDRRGDRRLAADEEVAGRLVNAPARSNEALPWSRFETLANRCTPRPKILLAYPNARFDAKHRGKSRMR